MYRTVLVRRYMMYRMTSRLRKLREEAGYARASDFAQRHGLTETTYRSAENGNRPPTIEAAKRYAVILSKKLNRSISWLYLIGESGDEGAESASPAGDDGDPAEIGRRLVLAREALGLRPEDLCRRTGFQLATYSAWERGDGAPSLRDARLLRRHFALTLDWLYDGDPSGLPHGLAMRIEELEQSAPPFMADPASKAHHQKR